MDNNRQILTAMMNVDYAPVLLSQDEVEARSCMTVPLTQIAALGAVFSPITTTIENVVAGGMGQQLFTLNPRGYTGQLAALKDGSGFTSTVIGSHGLGQAAFAPVNSDMVTTVTTTNPAMMFIAMAMISIDQKLDEIKDIQEEMFSFMKEKEKAKNKANMNALQEIINEYKFNWNNDRYIYTSLGQAKLIRLSSIEQIELYRAEVKKKLDKKSFIHTDQEVNSKINKVQDELREYQTALYCFAFSAFLEIMLLENFEKAYIDTIIDKIEEYSYQYRGLYTDCYNMLEEYSRKSLQSGVIKGFSAANKAAGNLIAKVPVVNKTLIDEGLVAAGEALEKVGSNKEVKTMSKLISRKNSCVKPFIDILNRINELFNQPNQIVFDKENVYIYQLAN